MKINLISLGCAKNLVDSEVIAGILSKDGHRFTNDLSNADAIILNTCAFIGPARSEGKHYINRISNILKKRRAKYHTNKKPLFILSGCLPQLEKDRILNEYPEIDAVVGSSDFTKIPGIIKDKILLPQRRDQNDKVGRRQQSQISSITRPEFIYDSSYPRLVSTGNSYAYVKIAEGCDNGCNYCLIPELRGSYRERKIDDIVSEARRITDTGIKELILISQDTTYYGTQQYGKKMLDQLIRKLAGISSLKWLRILYTHPGHFTDKLINTIAEVNKVCKYIDIPIQHTDDDILKRMGRPKGRVIFDTLDKLRKRINNLALRTTVMVGFPGETEKHFNKLLRDIKTLEFDSLGCFMFSMQKGTNVYRTNGNVLKEIKKHRFHKIMATQQKIVLKKNKQHIGKIYDVLIDSYNYGHTEFQSPEVDGKVFFKSSLVPGVFVKTKILGSNGIYDLQGDAT